MSERKARVTVTIDPRLAEYAERLVEAGKAPSVSAVVNDALEQKSLRDAYRIVGKEVTARIDATRAAGQDLPSESLDELVQRLHARPHLGGTGNLGLDRSYQRLAEVEGAWQERSEMFEAAIERLTT